MNGRASIHVRAAGAEELERLNLAYTAWGYPSGASPQDTVILAERGGELVGLVRQTLEHGVHMLRGMQVAPQARRQGIGRALLSAFVTRFSEHDLYCIPYKHLVGFYGAHSFRVLEPEAAPAFLAERLAAYRSDGGKVLLMHRPGNSERDTTLKGT